MGGYNNLDHPVNVLAGEQFKHLPGMCDACARPATSAGFILVEGEREPGASFRLCDSEKCDDNLVGAAVRRFFCPGAPGENGQEAA